MERGARCACHARQERTDMDVYGRNTNCVASILGVQISVISKEMKFILGRLSSCRRFFFLKIKFKGGFERVNLSYAIVSFASIFPSVPISLCLNRYFARRSCLFEILVFLNLKVKIFFF